MSKFMKISNPVLLSEEYSCRQVLPKIGSSSNYLEKLYECRTFHLEKLYECRTFLKCSILKIVRFGWHRRFVFQYSRVSFSFSKLCSPIPNCM